MLLRYHKPTRQFYVWIPETKKRKCFGSDPKKAREKYALWLSTNGGPPAPPAADRATVADVVGAYAEYARTRYPDARERHRVATAIEAVAELHGGQPAGSFKAKALREVRHRLLYDGKKLRSRNYVNKLVRAIQTAWRWLAGEELVPAESATSVCLVRALGPGDGGLELPPVLPPADGAIAATLPKLPPLVRDMVSVQLFTGCRPGEVCRMRWEEISREPGQSVPLAGTGRTVAALKCGGTVVWVYAPGSHKTIKRGKARVIPIGPRAQAAMGDPKPSGLVFPTRLGTPYRADSYARAVARACRAANAPAWSPLCLRHAAASAVAEAFDDHTAASVLGHVAGSTATKVYVEQSLRKAADAASKIG